MDPPRDLTAVNIQTDAATLMWKPPQASVTGYTLTFSSGDGSVRVSSSVTASCDVSYETTMVVLHA